MSVFEPQGAAVARASGGHLHPADVIALLREVYADGIGTREEADELIAFDQSLREPPPVWNEFFSAAIADHVTRQQSPVSIVDDEKATWLINSLSRGRHAATASGFAAVLRVIEAAGEVAPTLAAYALRQLRSVVTAGPASGVRLNLNRTICLETAALIRRILLGCAGRSERAVTREEAEALFDLHDLAASGTNDADFDDLFFKAIAHHLIARAGGHVPPRREVLIRQSDFPNGMQAVLSADDTAWLSSQIMRDGRPTEIEFALLQYFAGGNDARDATTHPFINRAA
jgi:hypothetical protein